MSIAVGLGLADFPFSNAKAFWRWIALCEDGGVDSLWQTDRLVSDQPILECMSVMGALAGATRRIKFGMNVASVGLRDPLLLAKQCATIDVLSEGRLLPAFGIGNARAPDWQATGRSTRSRGERTNEGLEIIARLWAEDSVDFVGKHYQYRGASISPKPVQKDMPLWVGGSSAAAIRRTARYGTGWQAGFETPEETAPAIAAIKTAVAEEGRQIDDDHFGAGFACRFGGWNDAPVVRAAEDYQRRSGRNPRSAIVAGDTDDIMARITEYVSAGVSKFILRPIGAGDEDLLRQSQRLIDEILPAVARLNDIVQT